MACSFEFGNLEPGKGLMATTDSTKWTSDDFTLVIECAFLFVQVVAANANLFRLFAILVDPFHPIPSPFSFSNGRE